MAVIAARRGYTPLNSLTTDHGNGVASLQIHALEMLRAGEGQQLIELVKSIHAQPLPATLERLIVQDVRDVGGVNWFLVDIGREHGPTRATLVATWLSRLAAQADCEPATAWLARRASEALHQPPHVLYEGTARLLRQHLDDPSLRLRIDLVSEDCSDDQRATVAHKDAVHSMIAEWLSVLVSE